MNINKLNDLVNWADDNKKEDFKDFLLFINKIDENNSLLNMFNLNSSFNSNGKIKIWNCSYNKRFPDFDFEITLDGNEYGRILSKLTMDSFKKVSSEKFIVTDGDNETYEFEIKEGI